MASSAGSRATTSASRLAEPDASTCDARGERDHATEPLLIGDATLNWAGGEEANSTLRWQSSSASEAENRRERLSLDTDGSKIRKVSSLFARRGDKDEQPWEGTDEGNASRSGLAEKHRSANPEHTEPIAPPSRPTGERGTVLSIETLRLRSTPSNEVWPSFCMGERATQPPWIGEERTTTVSLSGLEPRP